MSSRVEVVEVDTFSAQGLLQIVVAGRVVAELRWERGCIGESTIDAAAALISHRVRGANLRLLH